MRRRQKQLLLPEHLKEYNPNIHFSNIHFWLLGRRERAAASNQISTLPIGGRKKEETAFVISSQKVLVFSSLA